LDDEQFDPNRYDTLRGEIQRKCILTYRPEECYIGYTLFTNYRSTTFYLMGMEGRMGHTWTTRLAKIGNLLPNGHLIYGHMWYGMNEIDWYSKELLNNASPALKRESLFPETSLGNVPSLFLVLLQDSMPVM